MRIVNLGILAHVDAGKTTLTERLLHAAGVIDEPGSVDDGTTRTDSLALERQRGITIKSAVVSFVVDDVTVNLIDTPGHPDFIAEVERVLSVLDGAVLVLSAVEGVQPQTRLLMRALQRLGIPTLLFVNKIDRAGAGTERVLSAIAARLTPAIVPMGGVEEPGTRAARFVPARPDDPRLVEALAERDESLLAAYVDGEGVAPGRLAAELAAQTRRAELHPVFFGSAITGAGVEPLMGAVARLLPGDAGDAEGPVAGTVFKIERGPAGDKVAYVRLFSGTVRTRDRLHVGRDGEAKVTAIGVFDRGSAVRRPSVSAGEIAKLWGLADARIGETVGDAPVPAPAHEFPPPTLEAVVVPRCPDDGPRLRVALDQLAEQDPLIDVRRDDASDELSVSLYGEVQTQVIEATLADEYGIEVEFAEATPLHVERPVGVGEAVERLHAEGNPYLATIGLRIEPGAAGSGFAFVLDVDTRHVPLFVYKRREAFAGAMAGYVRAALREGLCGWPVTDCVVTMVECVYSSPDGPASTRGPLSTAGDFRKLTPAVVRRALELAGTVVCEPVVRVALDVPADALRTVLPALGRLGAAVEPPELRGSLATVETVLSATRAQELQRQLPGLTGGEGVLESTFAGYEPVARAAVPRRRVSSALDRV
jgi:ribosomal protection tetracycline resistance protein